MIQFESTAISQMPPRRPTADAVAPTVAWFAISAAARPAITRAIAVGDCVRRALVSHSDAHPTFVGRIDGEPRTGHRHAFFLPADDDGDGRLDRIVICARDGFDCRLSAAMDPAFSKPFPPGSAVA
jgi:hypothetical protein